MPKRKYYKRKRKRRRRRMPRNFRRKFTRRIRRRIPPAIQNRQVRRFRWVDADASMTSNSGTMQSVVYRCNSMHQPSSLTTDQPGGWDLWKTFYQKYCVIGAKISVYATGDAALRGTMGIVIQDDLVTFNDEKYYIENKRGVYRFFSNNNFPTKLTHSYSPKKLFAVTNVKDRIDELGASNNSNPTKLGYWRVWFRPVGTANEIIRFTVVIDYTTLLHDRVSLSGD